MSTPFPPARRLPNLNAVPQTAAVAKDPNEGLRSRKPMDYMRHYTPNIQAVLENGDIVLVEPFDSFGHFMVKEAFNPDALVMKSFNMATRFSTPLPALTASGSPSPIEGVVRALDVGSLELAHWRIVCWDPGYQIQVKQPESTFRFRDKIARRLSFGNTMYHLENGTYGMIPELFTFHDLTPIHITATSTEMNFDSFWVRVAAFGHKYYLEPVELNQSHDPHDPRIVATFHVGERTG